MFLFINTLRIIVVACGGVILVGVIVFYRDWTRQTSAAAKARLFSIAVLGLQASLQEVEQIGKPFVWWRLPLLFTGTIAGVYGLFWSMARHGWKRRPFASLDETSSEALSRFPSSDDEK